MEDNYEVYFHGTVPYQGSRMVVGAVLMNHDQVIDEIGGIVPYTGSSSRAHWEALIQGMELAGRNKVKRVIMKGDSRSVINYMNGQPPDRFFDAMDYMLKARKTQLIFDQAFFQWVPAEKNIKAIRLTMEAQEDE
jgi:ribonuclease HI